MGWPTLLSASIIKFTLYMRVCKTFDKCYLQLTIYICRGYKYAYTPLHIYAYLRLSEFSEERAHNANRVDRIRVLHMVQDLYTFARTGSRIIHYYNVGTYIQPPRRCSSVRKRVFFRLFTLFFPHMPTVSGG